MEKKMRRGPTNLGLKNLISELKTKAYSDNVPLFAKIAKDLEKPTRQRRAVNLSRINRYAKTGELIIVPGKVLAAGDLSQDVTIAAWKFSQQALSKIEKSNAKAITIAELVKNGLKQKNAKIIG